MLNFSITKARLTAGLLAGSGLLAIAHAAPVVVDFETNPAIPVQPNTYLAAGAMQTINVPGVATFTGGVVLGNATNFPAIIFATKPNTYASASNNVAQADPSLLSTINIAIDPSFAVNEVSLAVFNGMTSTQSYEVDAFNGNTLVSSQILGNMPSNISSGYGLSDLLAPSITSVTIKTTDASQGWDFLVDTVVFNGKLGPGIPGVPTTPEPASLAAISLGVVSLIRRKRRQQSA